MTLTNESKIYGFKQMVTALTAFVQNVESKFHSFISDLPVFVLWSGDNNLYMTTKLLQCKDAEVYEQTPRVVIKFENFSDELSNHTNAYNRYIFKSQDEENPIIAEATIKRLPIEFSVNVSFVSPNFIDALTHAEMILSIINRESAFSYEYQGSVFNASFASDSSQEFTFPEQDSGTRNFVQSIPIKLQIPLYSPRIETIKEYKQIEGVRIDIGIHDREDEYTSSRDLILQQIKEDSEFKKKVDKELKQKGLEVNEDNEVKLLQLDEEALQSQRDKAKEHIIES